MIETDANIDDVASAFLKIVAPDNVQDNARTIEHLFARITEEGFIEGPEYGEALSDETPDFAKLPLLNELVSERGYESKHGDYVELVWDRLEDNEKAIFLTHLGTSIDQETPKGKYWPNIRLLSALGREAREGLPPRVRIRLEGLIIRDVLAGHKDIHSAKRVSSGSLGTYARSLWRRFRKPEDLTDNLISLLRQNWYTQNYVGDFFFEQLPEIARATDRRDDFIAAIKVAMVNDARLVVRNIENLPDDWVDDIQSE